MMLRYNENLKGRARHLRKIMTDSEKILWSRLRGKQILDVQFYRQKPIGEYIVDFYGPKAKLVVEIDGSQHLQSGGFERDQERDWYLASLGLGVMRFNSREVLTNTDEVVEVIHRAVRQSLFQIPRNPL
jgi:very-short-patch-repair endonuclease